MGAAALPYLLRMSWRASSKRSLRGISKSMASFLISFWRSWSIRVERGFLDMIALYKDLIICQSKRLHKDHYPNQCWISVCSTLISQMGAFGRGGCGRFETWAFQEVGVHRVRETSSVSKTKTGDFGRLSMGQAVAGEKMEFPIRVDSSTPHYLNFHDF